MTGDNEDITQNHKDGVNREQSSPKRKRGTNDTTITNQLNSGKDNKGKTTNRLSNVVSPEADKNKKVRQKDSLNVEVRILDDGIKKQSLSTIFHTMNNKNSEGSVTNDIDTSPKTRSSIGKKGRIENSDKNDHEGTTSTKTNGVSERKQTSTKTQTHLQAER